MTFEMKIPRRTARRRRRRGGTIAGKHCAPGRSGFTCYSNPELQDIAKTVGVPLKRRTPTSRIWRDIDGVMNSHCDNEYCWTQVAGVSGPQRAFRPKMSRELRKSSTQWLSTVDISDALRQYESAIPGFKFLGAVPIDFDERYANSEQCVCNALCKIDLLKMWKKQVRQFGVVFNLDAHDLPGSHWVALHCSLENNVVSYYDSYGFTPPAEVYALIERLKSQSIEIHHAPMRVEINRSRHQFRDSECGVYAIYFISHMAQGMSFQNFVNKQNLNDRHVNRFRSYFFHRYA